MEIERPGQKRLGQFYNRGRFATHGEECVQLNHKREPCASGFDSRLGGEKTKYDTD